MGWTSYSVGNRDIRDCAFDVVKEIEKNGNTIVKTVYKSGVFYALFKNKNDNQMWVLKLLVDRLIVAFTIKILNSLSASWKPPLLVGEESELRPNNYLT